MLLTLCGQNAEVVFLNLFSSTSLLVKTWQRTLLGKSKCFFFLCCCRCFFHMLYHISKKQSVIKEEIRYKENNFSPELSIVIYEICT